MLRFRGFVDPGQEQEIRQLITDLDLRTLQQALADQGPDAMAETLRDYSRLAKPEVTQVALKARIALRMLEQRMEQHPKKPLSEAALRKVYLTLTGEQGSKNPPTSLPQTSLTLAISALSRKVLTAWQEEYYHEHFWPKLEGKPPQEILNQLQTVAEAEKPEEVARLSPPGLLPLQQTEQHHALLMGWLERGLMRQLENRQSHLGRHQYRDMHEQLRNPQSRYKPSRELMERFYDQWHARVQYHYISEIAPKKQMTELVDDLLRYAAASKAGQQLDKPPNQDQELFQWLPPLPADEKPTAIYLELTERALLDRLRSRTDRSSVAMIREAYERIADSEDFMASADLGGAFLYRLAEQQAQVNQDLIDKGYPPHEFASGIDQPNKRAIV